MTLEEAAIETIKSACVSAAVYAFYSSPLDCLKPYHLPEGYEESPIGSRARELFKIWGSIITPEILREIENRAEVLHRNLWDEYSDDVRRRILKSTVEVT